MRTLVLLFLLLVIVLLAISFYNDSTGAVLAALAGRHA